MINGHDPNPEQLLGDSSVTIYLRQDPFKETIYVAKLNILLIFAEILGALAFIYVIGFILTAFWTRYRFQASLIKGLYKIKHSSIPP